MLCIISHFTCFIVFVLLGFCVFVFGFYFVSYICLSLPSIAVMKCLDSKYLRGYKVYIAFQLLLHHEIIQGRYSKQEPEGKDWNRGYRDALLTNLLFMICSDFSLIQLKTTCSEICHPQWSETSDNSITRKCSHRFVHRPIWWEQFLIWGSFFPHGNRLCPVHKKSWSATVIFCLLVHLLF